MELREDYQKLMEKQLNEWKAQTRTLQSRRRKDRGAQQEPV